MGQFFTGPVNKAGSSSMNSLTRVHEWWQTIFWAVSLLKKVFTFMAFVLS